MSRMAEWGNDLYTGKRSIDFVGKSKRWYLSSAVVMLIAALGFLVQPLNLSLEFTGGSEFRVATTGVPGDYESRATDAVRQVTGADTSANVTALGGSTVRVQTQDLDGAQARQVTTELAETFEVKTAQVSSTVIGPSWGASVSKQALRALVVFLVLTTALMAIYYRNVKMAAASMVALAHDMFITVGIYAWTGFEVSPATMIGFLTVLGYSLYDTVVVFDHVKQNTREAFATRRRSFADAANLAVNQTLVRSINTTVIANLPIVAVLIIGFAVLGPGTLLDLSLALFIGTTIGAVSSVVIATPLLVDLRRKDPEVLALAADAGKHTRPAPDPEPLERPVPAAPRTALTPAASSSASRTVTGRSVHKYAQTGPRNQPKKTPRRDRAKARR